MGYTTSQNDGNYGSVESRNPAIFDGLKSFAREVVSKISDPTHVSSSQNSSDENKTGNQGSQLCLLEAVFDDARSSANNAQFSVVSFSLVSHQRTLAVVDFIARNDEDAPNITVAANRPRKPNIEVTGFSAADEALTTALMQFTCEAPGFPAHLNTSIIGNARTQVGLCIRAISLLPSSAP